jgi:hypothetical protein
MDKESKVVATWVAAIAIGLAAIAIGLAALKVYQWRTTSAMLVGASTPKSVPWDQLVAKAGPLDIRHHYWQAPPWSWSSAAQDEGRNATIGSVKVPGSITDASFKTELRSLLNGVPSTHTFYLIVYHEPEDEISSGQFTAARYIQWQVMARAIIDDLNTKREEPLKLVGTLMAYTTQKVSGLDIDTYRPPDGTWDALGWDGYDTKFHHTGVSESAQEIFDNPVSSTYPKGGAIQTNERWNLPFLIIETGTPSNNPNRVDWINAACKFAQDHDAMVFTYWNNDLLSTWQLDTDAEYKALGSWAVAQS